ncbi:unnamed protein product [Caenorhabditis nigoni]|uniref:non-specific serine/threonine protein kinase n=1 Tax=Caenorhabditis nigoni TaxID=1611254 RepID=A0A2G5SAC6_9PELO|nr:hypothetical protein B9Z55_028781 [Caenorhabditis nigoni]PIC11888.1 hypothetical protein B9Z55_028795 [Caenorhabditis nigoni]
MVFQAGQLVTVGKNRYQIAGKLGSGSYGSVYKANDLNEAREKAIKAIEGVDSDIQEVRALKRLAQVESVQKLFETFVFAGHVCLVMECYLADLGSIAEKQHFSQRLTCKVGFKLIDILRRVHHFGVLHRDLKPENLMISFDGRKAELKLIDFGISAFFMDQNRQIQEVRGNDYKFKVAPYSSLNMSFGRPVTEHDDLEMALYLLMSLRKLNPFIGGSTTEKESFHKSPELVLHGKNKFLLSLTHLLFKQQMTKSIHYVEMLQCLKNSAKFNEKSRFTVGFGKRISLH